MICKNCKAIMYINPMTLKQKKTKCLECKKLQELNKYWISNVNGFFKEEEARKIYNKEVK